MTAVSPQGTAPTTAAGSSSDPGPAGQHPSGSPAPATDGWSWEPGARVVADLGAMGPGEICEVAVSPDGERAAAVVEDEPDKPRIVVGGQSWEGELEKAWSLRFTPDGRAFALVRIDDEWTVMVEGAPWEQRFEFAWNPKVSGGTIAVQIKQDMRYGLALDGEPWEQLFLSCRDYALSPDGRHAAATVQVEELPEADIFKFLEGTWSVAVDGEPWARKFLNVYAPVFSPDGRHVAAEVRTGNTEYTVAEDATPWDNRFGCIWEPCYRPGGAVLAPVRHQGGWKLAENGKLAWSRGFVQLWRHVVSAGGAVAAAVATAYGRWSIAVDGVAWGVTFGDMVDEPVFSPDGKRVAAAFGDAGRWGIAVDGKRWPQSFDMASDPLFGPDGQVVVARVERDGRRLLAANGKVWERPFERLWQPRFSPDGALLLVRGIADGKVVRQVVPVSELTR